jgi:hypothetical protein
MTDDVDLVASARHEIGQDMPVRPHHLVQPAIPDSSSRSVEKIARYATAPTNRGGSMSSRFSRTLEWMPSAPVTMSASTQTPF